MTGRPDIDKVHEEEISLPVVATDPPVEEKAPGRKPAKVLDIGGSEFTSQYLDSKVGDVRMYEQVRGHEVQELLDYFEAVRTPLTAQLVTALGIMEGRVEDPYRGLRLPENMAHVSLSELQDKVAMIANAYMTYAEYLSAVRAVSIMRDNLYERRRNRAQALNEGNNELERKGLASMRSEPEFMQKTKVEMLSKYIETRYFSFKGMLEAAQQVLTTKSVESARKERDSE